MFLFIGVCYSCFVFLPFYLSKSKPFGGEILVLDGHLPDYVIEEAITVFNDGNYRQVVVTGGNLASGYHISKFKSMAELSYATFIALGLDSSKITALPTGDVKRNRTFSSGLALKYWLEDENITSAKIDVMTLGCHARRSQLLFDKALNENFEVGVIAVTDRSFDLKHWWRSSKGIRTIISETIGFIYSLLFFVPKFL